MKSTILTFSKSYCKTILSLFQSSHQAILTLSELLQNNNDLFRVHVKQYWHFHRVTAKQYWLFRSSYQTIQTICTSNNMFGRAISDKLPEWIFEDFEIQNILYWNYYLLTSGNYKTACNYKITPLMVQCRLQSPVWLYRVTAKQRWLFSVHIKQY